MPFVCHCMPFIGPFVGPNRPLIHAAHRAGNSMACRQGPETRSAGMTLIELMIALVVVAVLVTVGAPQWTQFVQNNRLTATSNDFVAAINLARSEAVKRSVTVVLCQSNNLEANPPTCGGTGKNWATGWLMYALDGNKDAEDYDKDLHVLVKKGYASPEGIKITSNIADDQWLGFSRDGYLRANSEVSYAVCDDRGAKYGRLIVVPLTGRPAIENTDPDDTDKDCTPT
jgi:type IV fimbrial biogenesis protein FimT